MEYLRLKDIKLDNFIGQRVFLCFMLKNKNVREQKDGVTKFVTFDMVDKDTVVDAKIFGVSEQILQMLEDGLTYNAAIDVKQYSKSKTGYSCIVYNIERSQLQQQVFVDWQKDLEKSGKIIQDTLIEVNETYFGRIAYPILIRYWKKFSSWTAARGQHHNQLGGLLTHTAEVVQCCSLLADYFCEKYGESFINRPLLLQAAMLHDVGKCDELDVDITSGQTQYSTYATLKTHIMDIIQEVAIEAYRQRIGYQVQESDSTDGGQDSPVMKDQQQLNEEMEAVNLLTHLLAQHHGKLEWGSPITPNTPEAFILNLADELSAEMYKYNREFKNMEPGTSQTSWNGSMTSTYKDLQKWGDQEFDKLD